jgi:hypothetical protein
MELTMGLCVVPTSAARTRSPPPCLRAATESPHVTSGAFFRIETAVQRDADLLAVQRAIAPGAEAQLNRRCAATPTAAASASAAAPRRI